MSPRMASFRQGDVLVHFLTVIYWVVYNGTSPVISTKMPHLSVILVYPIVDFYATTVSRSQGMPDAEPLAKEFKNVIVLHR